MKLFFVIVDRKFDPCKRNYLSSLRLFDKFGQTVDTVVVGQSNCIQSKRFGFIEKLRGSIRSVGKG
jgi:hypothetical protein